MALSLSNLTYLKPLIHASFKPLRISRASIWKISTIPVTISKPTNRPLLGPFSTLPIAALCLLVNIEPSILFLTHPGSGLCQLFFVLDLHVICFMLPLVPNDLAHAITEAIKF
ncbi:hypothetical protein GOBAR_DD11924 [Gossypium barbadense]|nr:hypothetical protein GOBAR_DD11924 [Gossypium barbadense]